MKDKPKFEVGNVIRKSGQPATQVTVSGRSDQTYSLKKTSAGPKEVLPIEIVEAQYELVPTTPQQPPPAPTTPPISGPKS